MPEAEKENVTYTSFQLWLFALPSATGRRDTV